MRFCISVPVCNQATLLPTALESIRCQSASVQLAVLDATPDNSVQLVLDAYRDIIQHTYHHRDAGQAAAIQEGWDQLEGEIVAWLNADDYYFPEALAQVEQVFRERPDVDVVYGHAVHVSGQGEFQMYFPAIQEDLSLLGSSAVICQPACFVRREALQRVGGINTQLHYVMDWDLWLRLYRAGCKFHFLNQPLAVVRIHADTKTLSRSTERYDEISQLLALSNSRLRRYISLLGFKYYDLQYARRSLPDYLAYYFLMALSLLNRASTPYVDQPLIIRGLMGWTNQVEAHCEVALCWYEPHPPQTVVITIDRPAKLISSFADTLLTLVGGKPVCVSFLGKQLTGYEYEGELPVSSTKNLVFNLFAKSGPWRLISLRVLP